MISNATRALCALLSTIGAAGLVVFANPANAIGTSDHVTATAALAAAPDHSIARG